MSGPLHVGIVQGPIVGELADGQGEPMAWDAYATQC